MARAEESYLKYLKAIEKRFWGYVNKNGALARGMTSRCWVWQGAVVSGYGQFNVPVKGKRVAQYTHRCAWLLAGGPTPSHGFSLHHLCANRLCVNANHMVMITHKGHSRLHTVILSAKCRNGHPFDEANPLIDGKGYRRCRECAREDRQRYNERRRQENAKKSTG